MRSALLVLALTTFSGCEVIRDAATTADDPNAVHVSVTADDLPTNGEIVVIVICDPAKGVTSATFWAWDVFDVELHKSEDDDGGEYFLVEGDVQQHYIDGTEAMDQCIVRYDVYNAPYYHDDSGEQIDYSAEPYAIPWPATVREVAVDVHLVEGSVDDWEGTITLDGETERF